MDIKNIKNKTAKIDLPMIGENEFIELREPSMREFNTIRKGMSADHKPEDQINVFIENLDLLLKDLIVDHSLTANSKKATIDNVYDVITSNVEMFMAVAVGYQDLLFFVK